MYSAAKANRELVQLGIPESLYAALGCFVDYAGNIPNLRCAVLFGSAVTGEFRKKSDIDILLAFEIDHDPEFGPEAKAALQVSSFIAAKYDLAHRFSFVFANLRDPNPDSHFLWHVAKEGIVLWGNPAPLLESMARAGRAAGSGDLFDARTWRGDKGRAAPQTLRLSRQQACQWKRVSQRA